MDTSERKINTARKIALAKGIINDPYQLMTSDAKNKRFKIVKNGKIIHFGLWPYNSAGTYLDHQNKELQSNWKKRHSKIQLKDGRLAYKVPYTPEYLSYNILW